MTSSSFTSTSNANSCHESLHHLNKVPRHVAIIMDGNGRWAQLRKKARAFGHRAGADAIQHVLSVARDVGIEVISLFAFSSENWNRPTKEVNQLLKLFRHFLRDELKLLKEHNVQLSFIGNRERFPSDLQKLMTEAEDFSRSHAGFKLVIAADYGGQWDILQATRNIARKVQQGELSPQQISEEIFSQYLCLGNLPYPDLFIRTSGEQRISNFFLWQLAYTELYFTDILWPDFNQDAFREALKIYAKRERRFGKVETSQNHSQKGKRG